MEQELSALEGRVKELERENRMLKDELAALDGQRPESRERPGGAPTFRLPSEQEVDKALDYFENVLKKFKDRLNKLERETRPKQDPAEPQSPGQAPQPPANATPKKEL